MCSNSGTVSYATVSGTRGKDPQVAEWERALNALVYELYGLTQEEIAIVGGT
jgi:hypothetical protein